MSVLNRRAPKGLPRQMIWLWGLLFIVAGAIGQGIIYNKVLGLQGVEDMESMVSMLGTDERTTMMALVWLLLQMAFACAIPIYCFLMVDGFRRTKNFRNYALRVAGMALLTEIPYNLCMYGKWFDLSSRNPMIAMALGLIMLFIFYYYGTKQFPNMKPWLNKVANIAICLVVFIMAFVWTYMLKIEHGMPIVLMFGVLWVLRKNRSYQILGGSAAMCVWAAISAGGSPLSVYWLAPVAFLVVFFYNDEQEDDTNKIIKYLAMPVILLVVGLIAQYAM